VKLKNQSRVGNAKELEEGDTIELEEGDIIELEEGAAIGLGGTATGLQEGARRRSNYDRSRGKTEAGMSISSPKAQI